MASQGRVIRHRARGRGIHWNEHTVIIVNFLL
jgi:hypothetical protein